MMVLPLLLTFSIHYRIEVIETHWRPFQTQSVSAFQYPLSDRSDWNLYARYLISVFWYLSVSTIGSKWLKLVSNILRTITHITLSVSTIGSKWLKQIKNELALLGITTFSIHYRIEVIETRDKILLSAKRKRPFSIHYRIEVIETKGDLLTTNSAVDFQYPLSDRSDWNHAAG